MSLTHTKPDFSDLPVLSFESRQSQIMIDHILRLGGKPFSAPSMQEVPLDHHPEVFQFADQLLAGHIQMVIFMTGVGVRYLFQMLETRYERGRLQKALNGLTVVARGPKSIHALKELGVSVTLTVPEPNTWHEILETLDENERSISLKNAAIAVQEYGESNGKLIQALQERGARVFQIPVYRWALPDDLNPLHEGIRQIISGDIRFLFFTSAHQIRNVLKVALQMGVQETFRKQLRRCVIVSIGPTCSEALEHEGIPVDFEPSHPKMGHLVAEAALHAQELLKKKENSEISITFKNPRPLPPAQEERQKRRQSPFIKACFCEKTPFTPIWLMRQAGRYMEEYNEIRRRVSFMELCKRPDLAAEVTIRAVNRIQADAAIIFSDILLILETMGLGLEYSSGEGPVISGGITSLADVDKLREESPIQTMPYLYEALRLTRAHMKPEIPLIGFSGAPFTLAAYAIEGGSSRNFIKTKQFMYKDPGAWKALMDKLVRLLVPYLRGQVDAGADALQVFDSWVGCLGPDDYRKFVLPYMKSLFQQLPKEIPLIHFGTGTGGILKDMSEAGSHVVGIDFRISLADGWKAVGHDKAVQGNLDPTLLLGNLDSIRSAAQTILQQAEHRPGHIFNLGHGVLPPTPIDHVTALVDYVHEASSRRS